VGSKNGKRRSKADEEPEQITIVVDEETYKKLPDQCEAYMEKGPDNEVKIIFKDSDVEAFKEMKREASERDKRGTRIYS
jgi:hypothetical protein